MPRPMIHVRAESSKDADAIRQVTVSAFKTAPHSSGTEGHIIDALRAARALALSLVADDGGAIVGHIAFSPVAVNGAQGGWFGLGPLSVRTDRQRQGIGQALVQDGLERLKRSGAGGCVVLGEPDYYRRFGFRSDPDLRLPGVPPQYFLRLAFAGDLPKGEVAYHPAFHG